MDDLNRCYQIIGIEPGAREQEIKQAYRDMTKVWHPDRFGHDPRLQEKAQEKLKEINTAYEILRNTPKPSKNRSSTKSRNKSQTSKPETQSHQTYAQQPDRQAPVDQAAPNIKRSYWKILLAFLCLVAIGLASWRKQTHSQLGNSFEQTPQLITQPTASVSLDSMADVPPKLPVKLDRNMVKKSLDTFIFEAATDLGGDENTEVRKFGFGDIDNDGDEDVAVTYALEGVGGGNNSHTQLAVFINDNGNLSFLDKRVFADYGRVVFLNFVRNGRIVCNTLSWTVGDPHCCPSIKKSTAFILSQGKLEEVGH